MVRQAHYGRQTLPHVDTDIAILARTYSDMAQGLRGTQRYGHTAYTCVDTHTGIY